MRNASAIFRDVKKILYPLYDKEADMLSYILLEFYLKIKRKDCIARKEIPVTNDNWIKLKHAIERLKKFEPIQYITGLAHFYGRDFMVKPGILIPRQETEELILLIKQMIHIRDPLILDIGAGSGCLAVTLDLEIPDSSVYALDKFSTGVEMTRTNAERFGAKVEVIQHDIFNDEWPLTIFDLIVSNPPYVRESEKRQMNPNVVNYEPGEALFVTDEDPLVFYRRILEISDHALRPGGWIFFEINEGSGKEIRSLLGNHGFKQIEIYKDLNGKDRFACGRKYAEAL
jgi:release factor glutamine methyltransferase